MQLGHSDSTGLV